MDSTPEERYLDRNWEGQKPFLFRMKGIFEDLIEGLETGRESFDRQSKRRLCTLYLLASHLYYDHDHSAMPDTLFDKLCKYLHENFESLREEMVWGVGSLMTKDNLAAGTCLGVDYPWVVRGVTRLILSGEADA